MFIALTNSLDIVVAVRPLVGALKKRSPKLAEQIERAATGIALNVAEGAERVGRDQLHLYREAAGSCREVRTALQLAIGWGHLDAQRIVAAEALLDRQARLLFGLTRPRGRNLPSEAHLSSAPRSGVLTRGVD